MTSLENFTNIQRRININLNNIFQKIKNEEEHFQLILFQLVPISKLGKDSTKPTSQPNKKQQKSPNRPITLIDVKAKILKILTNKIQPHT